MQNKVKTYIIHTQTVGGHQLEYLHHLYLGAMNNNTAAFVFVVPRRFEEDSKRMDWPSAKNIIIDIMEGNEEPSPTCGLLKKGWINSNTIRKYCKKYNATDVITISIMEYLPFLPFLVRNVRFSGIVYRIYLYEWKDESRFMRLQDALKYWIMKHFNVFHCIFMCNDSSAAACLNRIYHTNKFRYLPDPIGSLQTYKGVNLRKKMGIPDKKIVLLHPGGMNPYKNTLGILKALDMLDEESRKNLAVVFAGQVTDYIRNDFDILYEKVGSKMQLCLFEGFLPFELMADLFVTSDYVLVPYSVKGQSSGIVGHAAYYGKPVVSTQGGVIGKMVKKWKLGQLLYRSSETSIYQYLCSVKNHAKYETTGNTYSEDHSVEKFIATIFE